MTEENEGDKRYPSQQETGEGSGRTDEDALPARKTSAWYIRRPAEAVQQDGGMFAEFFGAQSMAQLMNQNGDKGDEDEQNHLDPVITGAGINGTTEYSHDQPEKWLHDDLKSHD